MQKKIEQNDYGAMRRPVNLLIQNKCQKYIGQYFRQNVLNAHVNSNNTFRK